MELAFSSSGNSSALQDGQEVQLDDGSIAYVFHRYKDCLSKERMQPVELDNGEFLYIYKPNPTIQVRKRTHTGEKSFECKWKDCNKTFATCYALNAHKRTHTGEKPFSCPQTSCKKAFKTSSDLQRHIRTHTGERPFKCPFPNCDKAFTTSDICKVHIRTHTGERPHKCPFAECGKSFTNYTNYKNHIRTHTGEKPYECVVCDKKFAEYSSLYKHQIVHSVLKPYTCSLCNKSYRKDSTLIYHKKRMHQKYEGASSKQSSTAHKPSFNAHKSSFNDISPPKETSNKVSLESALVVLPVMNSINSNCFIVNDTSNTQFTVLPSSSSEDKYQLLTSNVNDNALVMTLSSSPDVDFSSQTNDRLQPDDDSSAASFTNPTDDGSIYINKKNQSNVYTSSPALFSTNSNMQSPDCLNTPENSSNSNAWLDCAEASSTSALPKQQNSAQYSFGTLEIDGTKYVLQMVPDQIEVTSGDGDVKADVSVDASVKEENKYFATVPAATTSSTSALASSTQGTTSSILSAGSSDASQTPPVKSPSVDAESPAAKADQNARTSKRKSVLFPSAKRRITVKLPRKLPTPSNLNKSTQLKPRNLLPKLK